MENTLTHLSYQGKWFTTGMGKRHSITGWECRGTQPEREQPPVNTETGTGSTELVLTFTTGILENQTPTHSVQLSHGVGAGATNTAVKLKGSHVR